MAKSVEVTTPSDREIVVTRIFEAPARLVFECHTNPDYVRRWLLGPPGWDMPVCEIDLRVGGGYHYLWREAASGAQFGARGTYLEIVAPYRIVHTERMEGLPETDASENDEAHCTLTLTEQSGRTTLSQAMKFATRESRDQALASGMTDGMAVSYDRLEGVMADAAA